MNRGLLYIILTMVCIGLSFPIGSSAMELIPVWLFTFLTLAISTIVLLPAAKIVEKVQWTKLGAKNYFGIFMQSLFTAVLYTVFLLYGLTYSSVISAGIINSLTPAFTLFLAFLLLGEKLSMRKISAILLAISAVLIMELVGVRPAGGSSWLGNLFMILAVASLAMFYIYAKKFSVFVKPITMAAGLCAIGSLLTMPMAIIEAMTFDWGSLNPEIWGITLLYSLFGWVLAYIFTYYGMPKVAASTVGMATAIIPLTATVFAVLFLGEGLRTVDVVALVLVILSIFIAESQGKNEARKDLEENPVNGNSIVVNENVESNQNV